MSTLLMTIFIACLLIIAAIALLGLSWLITGKSKLRPGACGKFPSKRSDDNDCYTDGSCQLCEKKPDDKLQ